MDPDQPKATIDLVPVPDGSFADITAVYVGPTGAAFNPGAVLEDLHQLDVEERALQVLEMVRRVALTESGAAFVCTVAQYGALDDPIFIPGSRPSNSPRRHQTARFRLKRQYLARTAPAQR